MVEKSRRKREARFLYHQLERLIRVHPCLSVAISITLRFLRGKIGEEPKKKGPAVFRRLAPLQDFCFTGSASLRRQGRLGR